MMIATSGALDRHSQTDRPYQEASSEKEEELTAQSDGWKSEKGRRDPHGATEIGGGKPDMADEYGHPSSKFWSLYLSESKEEDQNLVENMSANTNGVLVFTGLFGAIVAAFIIESYKLLQPDPGAASVVLLAQISQQLSSNPNGTQQPSQSPPIVFDSPPFRPSPSALRVNILWFLSLALSLSCALAATLMQQWTRRYISATHDAQRAGSLQKQGQIHACLFFGLQTFRFKAAVEALPVLLHASVILFFVGLVDFLFPINTTVAFVVLGFVIIGALIYLGLSILPLEWPNSPYATPLTPVATKIILLFAAVLNTIVSLLANGSILYRWRHIRRGSTQERLQRAVKRDIQLEGDVQQWLLTTVIDDDLKLDKFVEGAGGFIETVQSRTSHEISKQLVDARGFMNRLASTLSSTASCIAALGNRRQEELAFYRQRAESYMRLIRDLSHHSRSRSDSEFYVIEGLYELQLSDSALLVSTACTRSLLLQRRIDCTPWATYLTPDHHHYLDNVVRECSDTEERHILAFLAFARFIFPHLRSQSASSISGSIAWETLECHYAYVDSLAPSTDFTHGGLRPARVRAEMAVHLQHLRTAILDAEGRPALRRALPANSVLEPRARYETLYARLRRHYDWLEEYEAAPLARDATLLAEFRPILTPFYAGCVVVPEMHVARDSSMGRGAEKAGSAKQEDEVHATPGLPEARESRPVRTDEAEDRSLSSKAEGAEVEVHAETEEPARAESIHEHDKCSS